MSELNPLNDLSRVYLDHVANANQQNDDKDIKRWEAGNDALDKQMEISSQQLATLGAPQMEEEVSYVEAYVTELNKTGSPMKEEKKAAKDYDGDGKVESGKDEYFGSKDKAIKKAMKKEEYDELDNELLEIVENTLGNLSENEILDLMESGWHRRNPGKKHPLESGSTTTKRRPVSDQEKKSTDKEDRMYVAMRRVKDRQKGYDADKSKAADKLHSAYTSREAARKKGASPGEAASRSHGDFGGKGFSIKRGGRGGTRAPETDRGTGNKARRRAGEEVKDKGYQKGMSGNDPKGYRKESFSDWRQDLIEISSDIPLTDTEAEKVVKEKKVNNKVVINPKMSEAVAQIGGEVISETQVELDEKQKDTPDQVKAVIAFDKARKGTDDATYDSEHGDKKQAKKERDYAKWQRDKGAEDAQKSGHRWKHAKGSTREKEGKKSETHAYIKDSYAAEGVLGTKAKGILGKEVKELEKASYTMKDTPVVKADKTDTPNYKGNKFGVKETKDWIQGAVKRPGAFTRKAKAADMGVQQFAKHVDDNPGKYSTRTKKQANLAQTFASMKKEDVQELFYTLIVD
jgi:hypothetical protein